MLPLRDNTNAHFWSLDESEIYNKKQNTNENFYWKNQNFLLHFYASYLLASTNLSSNTCKPNNKYNEQDYTVFLDYGIQETSFLKIASKMLNNQPPKKI